MKTSSSAHFLPSVTEAEKAQLLYDAGFRALSDLLVIAENGDVATAIMAANATRQRFGSSFRGKTVWLFQPAPALVAELRRLDAE